jgi:hypothetical protein
MSLRGLPDLSPNQSSFRGVRLDSAPDKRLNSIVTTTQFWLDSSEGCQRSLVLTEDLRFRWASVKKDGEYASVISEDLKEWDPTNFNDRTLKQIVNSIVFALERHVTQCQRDCADYARTKETADMFYWAVMAAQRIIENKTAPGWLKRALVEDVATNPEMRDALDAARATGDEKNVDAVIDQQLAGRE